MTKKTDKPFGIQSNKPDPNEEKKQKRTGMALVGCMIFLGLAGVSTIFACGMYIYMTDPTHPILVNFHVLWGGTGVICGVFMTLGFVFIAFAVFGPNGAKDILKK